jgi:hypothetical protein
VLAEAEGKEKLLLAEASGTRELAAALQQLSEQGRLIINLDKLPNLLDRGARPRPKSRARCSAQWRSHSKASIRSTSSIWAMAARAQCHGSPRGGGAEHRVRFLAQAKAQGLDISSLLKAIKVDPGAAMEMLAADGKAPRAKEVSPLKSNETTST